MNQDKVDWVQVVSSRKQDLFPVFGWSTGLRDKMDELIGDHVSYVMLIGIGNLYDGYYSKFELARVGEKVVSKVKGDPAFLEKHLDDFNTRFEDLVLKAKSISEMFPENMSNAELLSAFQEYYEKFRALAPFMNIPHSLESYANNLIKSYLRTELAKMDRLGDLESYFNKLAVPSRESFETEERKDLIKIAEEICQDNEARNSLNRDDLEKNPGKIIQYLRQTKPKIFDSLTRHLDSWAWVGTQSYLYPAYDLKFLLSLLFEIIQKKEKPEDQLAKIEKERKRMISEMKGVLDLLNPDEKTRAVIKILQEYIFLRTRRMEAFRKAYYHTKGLISEIARRMEVSDKEIMVISPDEMMDFLRTRKRIEEPELQKRIGARIFLMKAGHVRLYSGIEEVERIRKEEVGLIEEIKERIEGVGIFPGVVQGKVRIVKDAEDATNFQQGEILVTTMTMPDLAQAISKASAIVTDEGGITSHAALISRELQIPCVIGTQKATKVLMNGQVVKVDSNIGLVEVLSK